jgi:hypothetical protein
MPSSVLWESRGDVFNSFWVIIDCWFDKGLKPGGTVRSWFDWCIKSSVNKIFEWLSSSVNV